jgi:hypothetical protein
MRRSGHSGIRTQRTCAQVAAACSKRAPCFIGRRLAFGSRATLTNSCPIRVGWYGYAPGTAPSFYHTWYVKPQGDTCLVVTDEVGKGNDAAHLRETDESRWILHEGRRRLHPYPHAGPRGTRSIYHAVARLRGGAHCGAARLERIGGQSLRYQPRDNAFHQSPPATRVGFAM